MCDCSNILILMIQLLSLQTKASSRQTEFQCCGTKKVISSVLHIVIKKILLKGCIEKKPVVT